MRFSPLLLLALVACDSTSGPPAPRRGTVIYHDLAVDWNLYEVPATGGPPQTLLALPYDQLFPVWFPNHDRIAFLSDHDSAGIFVMNADGAGRHRVYADPRGGIFHLTWGPMAVSPSGQHLIFSLDNDLYILDLNLGAERFLTAGNHPTFSPDGQWVAFSSADGISKVRLDGSGRRTVVAQPLAHEPAWSPDGKWLAYTVSVQGGDLLFLATPDGSNPRQLTFPSPSAGYTWDLGAAWAPDGAWLAFQHEPDLQCPRQVCIMLITPRGGEPRRLTQGVRPSW